MPAGMGPGRWDTWVLSTVLLGQGPTRRLQKQGRPKAAFSRRELAPGPGKAELSWLLGPRLQSRAEHKGTEPLRTRHLAGRCHSHR